MRCFKIRTLDQIKYDNLRLSNCAEAAKISLLEYVNTRKEINKRRSVTDSSQREAAYLKEMEAASELLRRNEDAEAALNTILSVFSYTLEKPLDEKGQCPNCAGIFPADLWEWYNTLYCPYCGQRIQAPEDADSIIADSVL